MARLAPAPRTPPRNLLSYGLLLPMALLIGVALILPLLSIFSSSFLDSHGNISISLYVGVLTSNVYLYTIWNTLFISGISTFICLILGYTVAYRMARDWSAIAGLIVGILLLSFWTGLLIRTFAWMIILGSNGAIASFLRMLGFSEVPQLLYNRTGAIVGIVNILLPYMVLTIYSTMMRIDATLMRAAASLGASPFRAFWRAYLPLSLPGVWAGILLVFVNAIGFYITPELLGGPQSVMISQVVARVVQRLLDFKLAGALSLVLLIITLALIFVYNQVSRGSNLRG